MAIKLVDDVGAPAAVTLVDLVSESVAPDWNEWLAYIMAGGSYIAAGLGAGGTFVKNMGIASFPWAAKKIYNRVRAGTPATSRMAYRTAGKVQRYPGPALETPFQGVKLV